MEIETCAGCRFSTEIRRATPREAPTDEPITLCRRYPDQIDKDPSDWCGEWKPENAQDSSLKNGRLEEAVRIESALRDKADIAIEPGPRREPKPLDGTCRGCGREMTVGGGCGVSTRQARSGQVSERARVALAPGQCCDGCNSGAGQYHHIGCYREQCPFCGRPICDCSCCFE